MEGKYITRDQRGKLVDEIKKTHFKLGNYSPPPLAAPINQQGMKPNINILSLGMRETHFDLGKDKPIMKSESNSRFVPHNKFSASSTCKSITTDHTKTHYVLGTYTGDQQVKSPLNTIVKPEAKYTVTSSSAHHFKYGTDQNTPKSIASQDFIAKQVPMQDKEEVKKLKSELQKSHFGLGNEKDVYESTAKASYIGSTIKLERKNNDLLSSHFKLGTDKLKYESSAKNKEKIAQGGRQEFNESHLKDLRKSHFNLGNEKVGYKLTSQDIIGGEVKTYDSNPDLILRKTNFKLGTNQKTWKTSYEQTHFNVPLSVTQAVSDTIADKVSHFNLGTQTPTPYMSVHRNDFRHFRPNRVDDTKQAQFVREHHYKLGNFKDEHKTQNEKYGQVKSEKKDENKIVQDLRVSHFCLGNDKREIVTVSQESFKGIKGSVSCQNIKNSNNADVRKSKGNWITEQKSRFGWVKPVADNCFKFSFE